METMPSYGMQQFWNTLLSTTRIAHSTQLETPLQIEDMESLFSMAAPTEMYSHRGKICKGILYPVLQNPSAYTCHFYSLSYVLKIWKVLQKQKDDGCFMTKTRNNNSETSLYYMMRERDESTCGGRQDTGR